jgi:hypothetical protein
MRKPIELIAQFRVWLAAQMQMLAAIKRPDPVEVVAIALPVALEAATVILIIMCAVVWIAIANTPGVQP